MNTTSPFRLTIIPDVSSDNARARFSLCIDINSHHEVFAEDSSRIKSHNWLTDAKNFPKRIPSIIKGLKFHVYETGRNTGKEIHPDIVEEFPDDLDVNELRDFVWQELLTPIAGDGSKRSNVFIPPLVDTDSSSETIFTLKHPVISFGSYGTLKSLRDFITSSTVVKQHKSRELIKSGFGTAMDQHQLSNRLRNQRIVDLNKDYYQELKQLHYATLAHHVNNSSLAKSVKDNLNKLADDLAMHSAILDLSTHGAEYVRQAFNHVNNVPFASKFLRTLYSIEVKIDELPTDFVIAATHSIANDYVDLEYKTACTRPSFARHVVLPASARDGVHDNGIFALLHKGTEPNYEIFSFEPEAVAQNLYSASQQDAIDEAAEGKDLGTKIDLSGIGSRILEDRQKLLAELSTVGHAQQSARAINNAITNTPTKGQAVYLKETIRPVLREVTVLDESHLVKGYAVFSRRRNKNGTAQQHPWISLTSVTEVFHVKGHGELTKEPVVVERGIQFNMGQETTVDENGVDTGSRQVAESTFLFTWDGTKISNTSPMQQQVETNSGEELETKLETKDDLQAELQAFEKKAGKLINKDVFPFANKKATLLVKQSFDFKEKLQLKFGQAYDFLLVPQYHNDAVLVKKELNTNEGFMKLANKHATNTDQSFTRWNHINEFHISTPTQIFKDASNREPKPAHYGETARDLVVRTGNTINNDECSRYIYAPPCPSLQMYLWYDRENELKRARMDPSAIRTWYLRHQCAFIDQAAFDNVLGAGTECKHGCTSYCGGLKQPLVYDGQLHYLPDPVVTGFTLRLFSDPEYRIPFSFDYSKPLEPCKFEGSYPDLKPWKITLLRDHQPNVSNPNKLRVDKNNKEILVSLKPGKQLYAEIIPQYDSKTAHFKTTALLSAFSQPGLASGDINPLFSNITRLTLTHATEQPLINPVIEKVTFTRYHKDSNEITKVKDHSFKVHVTARFEHVNLWNGVPVPGILPTGEMELYALWNDFSDTKENIFHSISDKETNQMPFRGYIRLGEVKMKDLYGKETSTAIQVSSNRTNDDYKDHSTSLTFACDPAIQLPHHSTIKLRLRNTSKFTSYFPPGSNQSAESKERFSRWSSTPYLATSGMSQLEIVAPQLEATAGVLLSNQSMQSPKVTKILVLKLTDFASDGIKEHRNWIRVYFDPLDVNKSGEGHRIGLILKTEGAPTDYEKFFNDRLSQVGLDAVTVQIGSVDTGKDSYIRKGDILFEDLPKYYMDLFSPAYAQGSARTPEMITWRPRFDADQQLWYIDIGFNTDKKFPGGYHLLFAKLHFVHYQKFAANYSRSNVDTLEEYKQDYRFSLPCSNQFCTIRPAREFNKPWVLFSGRQDAYTFSVAKASLFFSNSELRSQFFLSVQQKLNGDFWKTIPSGLPASSVQLFKFHPLIPLDTGYTDLIENTFNLSWKGLQDFGKPSFRIVIMEIDYHDDDMTLAQLQALLRQRENENVTVTDIPGVRLNNIAIINHEPFQ
jgi:hypothetical protein